MSYLANFDRSSQSYRQKTKQHWGKKSTANFAIYLLLINRSLPLLEKKASQNFMRKKDDKVGNKNGNKKGKEREKEESEKKIDIDSQKQSKFWLNCARAKKR